MNSLKAYITDSVDFDMNILQLEGISKMIIRKGSVIVWSTTASSSAERFMIESGSEEDNPSSVYSIPLGNIADFNFTQDVIFLPSGEMAFKKEQESAPVSINLEKELHKHHESGRISTRLLNAVLQISKEQKVNDLAQFVRQNSVESLQQYDGFGAGLLKTFSALAEEYNLSLRLR